MHSLRYISRDTTFYAAPVTHEGLTFAPDRLVAIVEARRQRLDAERAALSVKTWELSEVLRHYRETPSLVTLMPLWDTVCAL